MSDTRGHLTYRDHFLTLCHLYSCHLQHFVNFRHLFGSLQQILLQLFMLGQILTYDNIPQFSSINTDNRTALCLDIAMLGTSGVELNCTLRICRFISAGIKTFHMHTQYHRKMLDRIIILSDMTVFFPPFCCRIANRYIAVTGEKNQSFSHCVDNRFEYIIIARCLQLLASHSLNDHSRQVLGQHHRADECHKGAEHIYRISPQPARGRKL